MHSIDPQGEYNDALEKKGISATAKPVVEYAPALILRKRSAKGLTEALRRIKERIETDECIPGEFADLAEIGPESDRETSDDPEEPNRAFHGEVFFPKPSNEDQRRIIDKIQTAGGVLVQGPPGTGKSHTIANLICHLLATGQRTLITAKTPRALQVLEGLIPEELRPLCINLLGSGLEERRSLESSVGGILRKNEGWKEDNASRKRAELESRIQRLREESAKINRRLRDIRESETHPQSIAEGIYRGTAARIAEAVNRDRGAYEWFTDTVDPNQPCTITKEDFFVALKAFREITADQRQELQQVLPSSDGLLGQTEFSDLVTREKRAAEDEKDANSSFALWRSVIISRSRRRKRKVEDEILRHMQSTEALLAQSNTHPVVTDLRTAIQNRNVDELGHANEKIRELSSRKKQMDRADKITERIRSYLPKLTDELQKTHGEPHWEERNRHIGDAWRWAQARYWLEEYINQEDAPALAKRAKQIEDEIGGIIAELASLHAWSFCFSRLEEDHRRHMEAWQQSMRRLGKGTGKHAPRHRREAQQHLNQCRKAVPAWVMPLHRVWDTVDPAPGMFDVIIVDEASQCGVEALPLFYLGKKILIVGDDKQISPDAVGLPRDAVHRLMAEFIDDFQFKSSFDVESSLFDHGRLRYGTRRITLREHFRCMPEIIRFSNDLCYSDTPLIPLRQYGSDFLSPLEHVFVEGGYREGSGNGVINRPEADAIVEKIFELCSDSGYDEKTMGVVVLQGEAQAARIEDQLLERLGAEEMERRRLICGNPYSFQGDERDIMLLSLVAAGNERIGPFTKPADERRFNVAASRARDQMILFHSVTVNDLSGSDLRRRLLEFFENTTPQRIAELEWDELERRASQDNRRIIEPPSPFESWFEVDVALELRRKNLKVLPQYEVAGKRIDLVVEGGRARLAVECDGDHWHGADRYEADMQRQRQLERCGWEFFRVRESAFYANKDRALEGLWHMLKERNIPM
uniref:AAA domain-containing protein n=1 Tax=Candidatus Kentrum sp. TC TaxID=2126339 RepID=A0A450Z6R3_9GAMM|nr:MAG: Protein of unknown function (DUF559) [Candidatus Kentron sp. TC]